MPLIHVSHFVLKSFSDALVMFVSDQVTTNVKHRVRETLKHQGQTSISDPDQNLGFTCIFSSGVQEILFSLKLSQHCRGCIMRKSALCICYNSCDTAHQKDSFSPLDTYHPQPVLTSSVCLSLTMRLVPLTTPYTCCSDVPQTPKYKQNITLGRSAANNWQISTSCFYLAE